MSAWEGSQAQMRNEDMRERHKLHTTLQPHGACSLCDERRAERREQNEKIASGGPVRVVEAGNTPHPGGGTGMSTTISVWCRDCDDYHADPCPVVELAAIARRRARCRWMFGPPPLDPQPDAPPVGWEMCRECVEAEALICTVEPRDPGEPLRRCAGCGGKFSGDERLC